MWRWHAESIYAEENQKTFTKSYVHFNFGKKKGKINYESQVNKRIIIGMT